MKPYRISQHIERTDEAFVGPGMGQPNWTAVLTVDDLLALRAHWLAVRELRRRQVERLAGQEDPDCLDLRLAREYAEAASDRFEEFDRAYLIWKEEVECTAP